MLPLSSPTRRVVPLLASCVAVVVLAACSPTGGTSSTSEAPAASSSAASAHAPQSGTSNADAPSNEASAGQSGAVAQSGVKRGEVLSPIAGEDWTKGPTTTTYGGDSLPMTAVFHDVRGAEHPDFYRVVVEFARDASPEKRGPGNELEARTDWVDEPLSQGRGHAMPNTGAAFLDLQVARTTTPYDPEHLEKYYAGEKNLRVGPIDVSIDGTFEGNTHLVIGMDTQREYQVGLLESPTRVVIDIKK